MEDAWFLRARRCNHDKGRMKRPVLFSVLVLLFLGMYAQADYNDFVGTWVYAKNDTVFKVKLQKGTIKYGIGDPGECIFGGYSLTVKGVLVEDYIKSLPAVYIRTAEHPKLSDAGIYIRAYNSPYYSDMLGFLFFDMKKKHIFGEELPCNVMILLSSDKLHWKLNEKEGLWFRLEGGPSPYASEEEERRRDEAWELRGFSVPDDVIMIKEE